MLLEPPLQDTERVRAAIRHLPPAERDLLVLRFRDGLSVAALAVATSTDVATVERRLHHAAWVVEDRAGGPVPGSPRPRPAPRSEDLLVEDAALGITPQLAACLAAAVAGAAPPPADDHWRWHTLLAAVRRRGEHVATATVALAVALPAAVSLAS